MASKFQTRPFPIDRLGKIVSITIKIEEDLEIEVPYPQLKLIEINGQLCWSFDLMDKNFIMPIARLSKIEKVIGKELIKE